MSMSSDNQATRKKSQRDEHVSSKLAPSLLGSVTIILLVSLVLAGCGGTAAGSGGSSGSTQIDLSVSPNPPSVGPAQLTLTLKDSSGNPVDGATVAIEGDMTHAGMVPVQATATGTGNGVYVANNFNFDMSGDWVLTVSATISSGDKSQRTFDFNGVSGNGGTPGAMGTMTGTMTMGTMTPGMEMTPGMAMTPGMEMTPSMSTMTPAMSMSSGAMSTPTPDMSMNGSMNAMGTPTP